MVLSRWYKGRCNEIFGARHHTQPDFRQSQRHPIQYIHHTMDIPQSQFQRPKELYLCDILQNQNYVPQMTS